MKRPNSIFSEQLAELVPAEQLQITKVRTLVVNAEQRNWILVKIETNQPGLYGWGEASLEMKTRGVLGAIEDLTPLVVGENPTRIEHLYQKLYRGAFFREGVIGMSAISGIEHALWDIFGKVLNVPVYKLLGEQFVNAPACIHTSAVGNGTPCTEPSIQAHWWSWHIKSSRKATPL